MNRRRWMRTRDRLKARALDRSLARLSRETIPRFQRGGVAVVGGPPGPELATLPKGTCVTAGATRAFRGSMMPLPGERGFEALAPPLPEMARMYGG